MSERKKLINRFKRLRAEITQTFLDAEYWNNLHPEEPIDPDPNGILERMAQAIDEMLTREEIKVVKS